jgi:hypothetical protein
VPRYLGCNLIRNEAATDLVILESRRLPLHFSDLASREELSRWLTRIFIYTILPGHGGFKDAHVSLPNNLVAFIDLLVYLHGVGFPGHWVSDFMRSILANNLVTDIAPYLGKWPIPVSDASKQGRTRRVCLSPWLVELDTILALTHVGLPFALALPEGYSRSSADVGTFEATLTQHPFNEIHDTTNRWCLCMMLMKMRPNVNIFDAVRMLPDILEGKKCRDLQPEDVVVLTSLESADIREGVVTWKMSRQRVGKMQQDKIWSMVLFRTDIREPCKFF